MTSYQDALVSLLLLTAWFRLRCYWDSIRSVLPVYVLRSYFYVYRHGYVFCAIGCQYSTLNRLFGCVFLVWRHHLRKVDKSSVHTFRRFFLQFSYCLMFLNIQIHLIILKTHDQQFTLTTKNHCISSLRETFKNSTIKVRKRPSIHVFSWISRRSVLLQRKTTSLYPLQKNIHLYRRHFAPLWPMALCRRNFCPKPLRFAEVICENLILVENRRFYPTSAAIGTHIGSDPVRISQKIFGSRKTDQWAIMQRCLHDDTISRYDRTWTCDRQMDGRQIDRHSTIAYAWR